MTPLRLRRESLWLQKFSVTNREPLRLKKFSVTNAVLPLPFLQQIQFTLHVIVNVVNLNWIIEIKELYCMTKQEEGKLRSKFTRWPPSGFEFSRSADARATSCIPHDSVCMPGPRTGKLKMAFFVVILESKYSKMTPEFVKQKSHWIHSSIKFANPGNIMIRPDSLYSGILF